MTSYLFEKAAKNAVIDVLKNQHDVTDISLSDLQLVWLSYTLGNIKCTVYSPKMGKKYAEVTYNKLNNEIYVDMYEKISNTKIASKDFNVDAGQRVVDQNTIYDQIRNALKDYAELHGGKELSE